MAVSPRLARKFQQTLGSDAAEDLVSWMDQVDSQGEDVRVLIARIGEWREASRADLAELRQEMHSADADARADIRSLRSDMRADMANVRADLIKWSFVFWATTLGAVLLTRLR
ncbi:MAG: hypothetical protein WD801_10980 [Gemmatimonadaceae bacterium]